MPTYDYQCTSCNHEFELFQSMKDKTKRKCPECGKNTLERLIGIGSAVLFKGSGFYETDYRSKSYKDAAKADKPKDNDSSKTESKSSTEKSSAKPDTKPNTKVDTPKNPAPKSKKT